MSIRINDRVTCVRTGDHGTVSYVNSAAGKYQIVWDGARVPSVVELYDFTPMDWAGWLARNEAETAQAFAGLTGQGVRS